MAIDTQAQAEVRHFRNYIGGEWVDAASGQTFDVVNPATEESIATVPAAEREDAHRAIGAARAAFDSGSGRVWSPRSAGASCCRSSSAIRGRGRARDARDACRPA